MTRAYFLVCLVLGWLLRSARYSKIRIGNQVRKRRVFYAPLLIGMSGPLLRVLDAGVRVLPRGEWEERERRIYRSLYGTEIQVDADGTLILPCLSGDTLAALLDDATLDHSTRARAITLAVAALADFHRRGFTHGDAMAENVTIDLDAGRARWFDFETVHESHRAAAWRRADDVRALLATCVRRAAAANINDTLSLIVDGYADEEVTGHLAASFASALQRPLIFHLAQAQMPLRRFRQIDEWLRDCLRRERA